MMRGHQCAKEVRPSKCYTWRFPCRCRTVRERLLFICCFSCLSFFMSYRLGAPLMQDVASVSLPAQRRISASSALQRSILAQKKQEVEVETSRNDDNIHPSTFRRRLEKLLMQVETESVRWSSPESRTVIICGKRDVTAPDLAAYTRALRTKGFAVRWEGNFTPISTTTVEDVINAMDFEWDDDQEATSHWALLLNVANGQHQPCPRNMDASRLGPHQKANWIPALDQVLRSPETLCSTLSNGMSIPALMNHQISPMCFNWPEQREDFLNMAEILGPSVRWIFKPSSGAFQDGMQVLDVLSAAGREQINRLSGSKGVVEQLVSNVLDVSDRRLSLRLFVLLASISPLRAYVHSQGVVHHHDASFQRVVDRIWPLSRLWKHLSDRGNPHVRWETWKNIQRALVQTLLLAEAVLLSSRKVNGRRVPVQFYHLLSFDLLLLNSSLQPMVLKVRGLPGWSEEDADTDDNTTATIRSQVLEDVVGMLFSTQTVASEVSAAIDYGLKNVGIMGLNCHTSHELCLSREDLRVLMDSRREARNLGGFRQLYPEPWANRYDALVAELGHDIIHGMPSLTRGSPGSRFSDPPLHRTADLHPVVVSLERHYHHVHTSPPNRSENSRDSHTKLPSSSNQTSSGHHRCTDDSSRLQFLQELVTVPQLLLRPSFSFLVTDYLAVVDYHQVLITLWAWTEHCRTEARIDDPFASTRSANYTLGVGHNRITIYVVDVSHVERRVLNTYTLLVRRLPITHKEPPFVLESPHQVCSLKQECDMRLFVGEPCGLQESSFTGNWAAYLSKATSLPLCDSGDSPGDWILPCRRCSDQNSCFWSEAFWQPEGCRHQVVAKEDLERCLAGKKLLFIGDSTNRGMMHYLMERLNGSLTEWDKTHDIRLYPNLNGGRTFVSFAYYPQFWLPTPHRPVFDKALYQLIRRSRPLTNSSDTVLVVGGVQWLATQHLHTLLRALKSEHLHGIKLIVKTFGTGFHQPVDGIHWLTQTEQQKLTLQNAWLADFAKHYGIEVVDTFNMTLPRYKDFFEGKCACHFHKVVQIKGLPNRQRRYHVEGAINAIYSDILLDRICRTTGR